MLDSLLSVLETEEEKILIEKLFCEYESQMFSVAYSILQHRQEAEDVVENAFLKVIEQMANLHLDINIHTQALLTIITKNIALNEIKKQKRQLDHEIDIDDIETIPAPEFKGSLSYSKIKELINKLPSDLKHVVIMRYILGYTSEETAKLLDISSSAVYKRISASKKLLIKLMEDSYAWGNDDRRGKESLFRRFI